MGLNAASLTTPFKYSEHLSAQSTFPIWAFGKEDGFMCIFHRYPHEKKITNV